MRNLYALFLSASFIVLAMSCGKKADEALVTSVVSLQTEIDSMSSEFGAFQEVFEQEFNICREGFPLTDSVAGTASAAEAIANIVEGEEATTTTSVRDSAQFFALQHEIVSYTTDWPSYHNDLEDVKVRLENGEIEEDSVKAKVQHYQGIVSEAKGNLSSWKEALENAKRKCAGDSAVVL